MKISIKIILYLLYYISVDKKRLTIDKLIAGGDGLGYIDGKAHFVPQSLPGEIVDIEIIEDKKGFNRCRLVNVVTKSVYRVEPFCSLYGKCGGCNLQYTEYENQLSVKKQIVKDIFLRNGRIELGDFNFISSKDQGYRNRVQLHCHGDITGFKKRQSDEIINIKNCPLLVDGLNNMLSKKNSFSKERITLFSDGVDNYIGGFDKSCTISILGKKVSFNPEGFFQSNLSLLPELIKIVSSHVTGTSIMDLYCGVGLFSIFLPENVKRIIGVEIDDRVEPFINKNLEGRPFTFYPMSLEKYISKGLHKKNIVDTIIVDPPRKGLSKDVRKFLSNSGVKRVIYVSCDPVTMARDILELKNRGYSLSYFSCLDFYPNTTHIESVGVLDLA